MYKGSSVKKDILEDAERSSNVKDRMDTHFDSELSNVFKAQLVSFNHSAVENNGDLIIWVVKVVEIH